MLAWSKKKIVSVIVHNTFSV